MTGTTSGTSAPVGSPRSAVALGIEEDYLAIDTRPPAGGRVEHPLLALTFAQVIARQAEAHPERELLVDGAERVTFAGFASSVTDVSRALMACGVERGDRIAVWAPNSIAWLVAAFGGGAAGAALIPMNSRFRGAEALDVVRRGRPRVLFTVGGFLGVDLAGLLRAESEPGELENLVVVALDGVAGPGTLTMEEFLALGESVGHAAAVARRELISAEDVSDMVLTSGTTGRPRATMTTHRQNLLAFVRLLRRFGIRPGERINATLPFFHNFGLKVGFLSSVLMGGTCIVEATFDPARLARLIETERITFLPGPPTLFASLLDSPARAAADLGSLRLALVAGAMVPRELVERMQAELCSGVVAGYGLSELAGAVALTVPGAPASRVAGWAGRIVEGVEVRIVGDDGLDVAPGEPGEILARSECVMVGYLDDPAGTAAAIDDEGWLHTGDVGIVDDEQYLRITDRKKDMYIVGGFNTYPAEIERLLLGHPRIAQVAVVGMPDERLGEVGAAFVVAAPGAAPTPEEVIAWARGAMANYKVPRRVEILDHLPVNASMKVLKSELRARLAARGAGGPAS